MISHKRLEEQLKKINCYSKGWGRSEMRELCNILMPDEEVEECVNGYYDAGFALLVGTKDRLLLVDKKPLGYLTVEDMRFDMINEFDLHHRLLRAQVRVSAGNKTLHFTSMNQARLRRLLSFVQSRMTQIRKDDTDQQAAQKKHLEEMNEQLRLYLMAAHKQQFVDQAQSLKQQPASLPNDGPAAQPPAAAFYEEPHQPVQASHDTSPVAKPVTPFEQVAAAAFEAQTDHGQSGQQTNLAADEPSQAVPTTASGMSRGSSGSTTAVNHRPALLRQIGLAAVRRVVPLATVYTRLPGLKTRRRYQATQR